MAVASPADEANLCQIAPSIGNGGFEMTVPLLSSMRIVGDGALFSFLGTAYLLVELRFYPCVFLWHSKRSCRPNRRKSSGWPIPLGPRIGVPFASTLFWRTSTLRSTPSPLRSRAFKRTWNISPPAWSLRLNSKGRSNRLDERLDRARKKTQTSILQNRRAIFKPFEEAPRRPGHAVVMQASGAITPVAAGASGVAHLLEGVVAIALGRPGIRDGRA